MKKLIYGFLMICLTLVFTSCIQSNTNKENSTTDITGIELVSLVNTDSPVSDLNEYHGIEQRAEEDTNISLKITNELYPIQADAIPYSIVNNSGEQISVVLIPLLEMETDNGWKRIDTVDVGFCGTPDQIDSLYIGSLPLSWYADSLTEGRYRLSFKLVNNDDYEPIAILSDIFILKDFDVTMSVKEHNINSKGITLVLMNNSEQEYTYGEHYTLERKSGDKWDAVNTIIQDYGFNDIGYPLRAKQISESSVNWEWLYGVLDAGEYRITKDLHNIKVPGEHDIYYLSAEFVVN